MKVSAAVLAGAVVAASCGVHAQQPLRALPIETALEARSLAAWQPPALSPDAAYVAYIACNAKKKREIEDSASAAGIAYEFGERWFLGCHLEVVGTTGGGQGERALAVTSEDSNSHGLAWSPDGKTLAYVAGTGAEQRLYLWDRDSKASRRVSERQVSIRGSALPVWFPDSRHLLVMVPAENSVRTLSPVAPTLKSAPAGTTVSVYRSASVAPDGAAPPAGPWLLGETGLSLARVDTSNAELEVIVPEAPESDTLKYNLSPDGKSIAYTRATRFAGPTSQQELMDVHIVTLSNGKDVIVARDVPMQFGWGLSWSPDSGSLAWTTAGVQAPYDVSVHRLVSGKTRTVRYAEEPHNAAELRFTRMSPIDLGASRAPIWNADGRELYVIDPLQRAVWKVRLRDESVTALLRLPGEQILGSVRYARSFAGASDTSNVLHVFTGHERTKEMSLYEVDLRRGVSRKLWSEDAQITDVVGSADGKALAYLQQRADANTDVWFRPMPAGEARRISHASPDFDAYVFGKSRLVEWTTGQGEHLQGVLMLPAGYVEGKRYPLIVFPYGGASKSHNLHHFAGGEGYVPATTDNLQLFATRGYAVLLPDAPARVGTIMRDYAESIMPGVDAVIASGVADPERLGVMGHSNGGYTVMSLIVQTTRFKAAVSRAGFSDYTTLAFAMNADGSNYALNIAEEIMLGASLWQDRSRWLDNSPLFFFDRVQTPTLIVHGGDDYGVHPFAADQAFVALRRLGKAVEYARYANEGHSEETWSYPNRIDYVTRVIGWFDRFLCPQRPSETVCN